jgi:hypothetical protein
MTAINRQANSAVLPVLPVLPSVAVAAVAGDAPLPSLYREGGSGGYIEQERYGATTNQERYTLTLQAMPDPGGPSAPRRLARLLKYALRSCRLKCTSVLPARVASDLQDPPAAPVELLTYRPATWELPDASPPGREGQNITPTQGNRPTSRARKMSSK